MPAFSPTLLFIQAALCSLKSTHLVRRTKLTAYNLGITDLAVEVCSNSSNLFEDAAVDDLEQLSVTVSLPLDVILDSVFHPLLHF